MAVCLIVLVFRFFDSVDFFVWMCWFCRLLVWAVSLFCLDWFVCGCVGNSYSWNCGLVVCLFICVLLICAICVCYWLYVVCGVDLICLLCLLWFGCAWLLGCWLGVCGWFELLVCGVVLVGCVYVGC